MRLSPLLIFLLPTLLAGCSSGGADDDGAFEYCEIDDRHDEYVPGLTEIGEAGLLKVELLEARPDPPDVGASDWTVAISDMDSSEAVVGCTVRALPWMPDHEHGGTEGTSTDNGDGTYEVEGMRYAMSGYWEITLELECGDLVDQAIYRLCLRG